MKSVELYALAVSVGLDIQHDCGGYRVVDNGCNVFPEGGTCPTATKKECAIFLAGVKRGQKEQRA